MPVRFFATLVLFLSLAGCGYVGPVLPPSPELPQAIADLSVVERGDQLLINFTAPARTTDSLPVPHFSHVDLRIGTYTAPFDFNNWAAAAKAYELPPPLPADSDNPVPAAVSEKFAVSDWAGKRVAVAVRTAIKKNDHFSAWSNRVVIEVVQPIAAPAVELTGTAKGIVVSWKPVPEAEEYRVSRQTGTATAPVQLGVSKTDEFLDDSSQYETPYVYTVVAARGLAESLPASTRVFSYRDTFAPSVPSGITALAGPNTIEISWQRSPESDLKGYYLYRSVDNGPYTRVGDLLTLPAYSDHNIQHGKTYRYQVSATDQNNNESARSPAVEVTY